MKFNVEKTNILNAISKISGVTETHTSIQGAACFLVKSQDGKILISATDMDMQASVSILAEVEKEGSFCIKANVLHDLCRKVSGSILFEIKSGKLEAKAEKSKYKLSILDGSEFPAFTSHDYKWIEIDSDHLKTSLSKTVSSISKDESRHYISGVYLHKREGMLSGTGTDGNRLAVIESTGKYDIEDVILPQKLVTLVLSTVSKNCFISVEKNIFAMKTDDFMIVSKVIDGQYPDYNRIIPKKYTGEFTVDVENFIKCIDRATVVRNEKTNAVTVTVNNDCLSVSSVSDEGVSFDETEASYNGLETSFKINYLYLLDVLKNINNGVVSVRFNEPNAPMLFKPVNDDNSKFIIMPMRG
jgi:DNA polymerase III subunit beta